MSAVVAVCLIVLSGCSQPEGAGLPARADAVEAPAVPVAVVAMEPVRQRIRVVGSFIAAETVLIPAEQAGLVASVEVDSGMVVAAGATLAVLDDRDARLALERAQADLNEALALLGLSSLPTGEVDVQGLPAVQRASARRRDVESELRRIERLRGSTAVTERELIAAQALFDQADADVRLAIHNANAQVAALSSLDAAVRLALRRREQTKIVAPPEPATVRRLMDRLEWTAPEPLSWYVARRLTSPGQYASAGQTLFELVLADPIKMELKVPQQHANAVRIGQEAKVLAGPDQSPLDALVCSIRPVIDPASRTFDVELLVDNRELGLKPGAFARSELVALQPAPAMLVNAQAVSSFAGTSRVFVVEDGRARRREVRLGDRVDDRVIVVAGLSPGEVYITGRTDRIVDGQAVLPEQTPSGSTGERARRGR